MLDSEHALTNAPAPSWMDKLAKQALLSVFKHLPAGELTIKERGVLVDVVGDRSSELKAEVNVLDPRAWRILLLGGSIGAGESYTDNLWDTPNLTNVIRLFARNLPIMDKWESRLTWLTTPMNKLLHFRRRNSAAQAKANIAAHYDLGNVLYEHFLDESMMYSAAIYPDANASLRDAQQHKLKTICDKLQLCESDHLLEIGTGWGALAIYAAKHYGCKVTTTTISEEQYALAIERVKEEGLEDKITLLKKDYRVLEGKYDKLVSIEMIEAVGKAYLPNFFKTCNGLLKENGLMLLQAITIHDQRYDSYNKGVDFIQKHIFPGGFLPSQLAISDHVKKYTNMLVRDLHDIGLDYAYTLRDWHHNFNQQHPRLKQYGFDDRFARLWRFYFSYCEGGFLERTISTVQVVLTKPGFRQTLIR